MHKMFSGPASGIDYQGRLDFLQETTAAMNPAPIDTLLDLVLPTFSKWRARDQEGFDVLIKVPALTTGMGSLDDSTDAAAVKKSIASWMSEHRFGDPWIGEAGFFTLFFHAAGRAKPRGWYVREPWDELRPMASVPPLEWRGPESGKEYIARFRAECRRAQKELVKAIQFGRGERKGEQSARWAALRFTVPTFAEVARRVNREEDAVRHGVVAFARRTGLTLPTLGDSLTRSKGKAGKTRALAG